MLKTLYEDKESLYVKGIKFLRKALDLRRVT